MEVTVKMELLEAVSNIYEHLFRWRRGRFYGEKLYKDVYKRQEGLCKAGNVDVRKVLKHSLCLSADVNAAYDPTFASVFEEKNSCYLNKGVVLTKYTGCLLYTY